jgi:CheY-like chemotaxis protein
MNAHQHAVAAAATGGEAVPRAGLRVLLAEDHPVNQQVASAMLLRLGAKVVVAADGRAAVTAVADDRTFDLVLMDCHMPELDGFSATAAIRSTESGGRRLPIIALTADVLPGDRDRCLAAGMDDHLSKPVRMEDLARVLTRWCGA